MQLQSRLEDFEALGARIWAVSPDDPERLRSFVDAEGIGFPILLDAGAETAAAWGIYNETNARFGPIPHPTTLVIDRDGVVRFVEVNEDYRERPVPDALLAALAALGGGS